MIVHGAKTGKEALHVVPRSLFEAEVCLRDFECIPDSRKSPARKHIAAWPQLRLKAFRKKSVRELVLCGLKPLIFSGKIGIGGC